MTFLCIYDSILDIHKFIAILRAEGERKPLQNEQNTRRMSVQCRRQKQFREVACAWKIGSGCNESGRSSKRYCSYRNGFAERLGINTEKATGVDVDSAAVEGVLSSDSSAGDSEKDSREGSSNGLTPKEIEALKRDARVVVISTP